MVAVKTPSLAETYGALCGFLRANAKLNVNVVNHIAAKHSIHSLPAFHNTDAISDADKLATYGELVRALVAHAKGDGKALATLKGQVANGQAAEAPQAEAKPIPDIPKFEERKPEPTPTAEVKPRFEITAPVAEPKPKAARPPRAADPLTDRLREIIIELIGEQTAVLDEAKVGELVDAKLEEHTKTVADIFDKALADAQAAIKPAAPTVVRHELKLGDVVNPIEGVIHRQLLQIVAWLNADVPVWLWGQAGGGKTHLARQVAQAMSLSFYCAPIDETITVGKLVGFRNVSNGEFVEGLMYRSYKLGGLQLLDEIDTNATAIASTNSLTANGHYTFPNGEEVTRHPKFRLIAGANTKGTGAVAGYTARIRMDAATLDRFAVIKLDYDPDLELALTCGVPSAAKPWTPAKPADEALCRAYVDWVQRARAKVGDSVLISPRASYLGVRALRAGIPPAEVAEALVFKLVTDDTRRRIINDAGAVPV